MSGVSLVVAVLRMSLRWLSASLDRTDDLFNFMRENVCSHTYVLPKAETIFIASFLKT